MIDQVFDFIRQEAEKFGGKAARDGSMPFIERKKEKIADSESAFFGLINVGEERSGPYSDFSLVVFPTDDNVGWLICLGVGTLGFRNDTELAARPGVRRLFKSIISTEGFCKTNFHDIISPLPKAFRNKVQQHKKNIENYLHVLPVCDIIEDPSTEEGKKRISAFVAAYARLRDWPNSEKEKKAVDLSISKIKNNVRKDEEAEALALLRKRKYMILEGAPGTGKTRLASELTKKLSAQVFFTQFHPEVNYSDFVEGIKPDLNGEQLLYRSTKGILIQAIEEALRLDTQPVVLIIDEINRANLSSVLGPLFYLLEYKRSENQFPLALTNGETISSLPSNFYIIGTMNTSDRSLAVVDFALRRRFAWYSLKPKSIDHADFHKEDFERFDSIFDWYASSQELNYQPGQAYFLANNKEEMKMRIRYELYPLIKEYLDEGILLSAKEELDDYFVTSIGQTLFI